MKNKHILVTGGAGFIGSNLINCLFKTFEGIRITCIDNFSDFYPPSIKQKNIEPFLKNNFKLIHADIALSPSQKLIELIPDQVDIIVHLAAKAGVRPSLVQPAAYIEVNLIGLQHLLDFAIEKNVEKFVFGSSSSVYGINDHFPWNENEQLMPISPYAATKVSGEFLGKTYAYLYQLPFVALRFFTVYGPSQRPDLAIYKFTKAIIKGDKIPFFGEKQAKVSGKFPDTF